MLIKEKDFNCFATLLTDFTFLVWSIGNAFNEDVWCLHHTYDVYKCDSWVDTSLLTGEATMWQAVRHYFVKTGPWCKGSYRCNSYVMSVNLTKSNDSLLILFELRRIQRRKEIHICTRSSYFVNSLRMHVLQSFHLESGRVQRNH